MLGTGIFPGVLSASGGMYSTTSHRELTDCHGALGVITCTDEQTILTNFLIQHFCNLAENWR